VWVRGKDAEQPGKFAFELYEGRELVQRVGGFANAQDADRAAEKAQRALIFPPEFREIPDDIAAMSNAELLAELGF
jgi:hypothetical protein